MKTHIYNISFCILKNGFLNLHRVTKSSVNITNRVAEQNQILTPILGQSPQIMCGFVKFLCSRGKNPSDP